MNLEKTLTKVLGDFWFEFSETGVITACYTDKDWAIAEIKEQSFF